MPLVLISYEHNKYHSGHIRDFLPQVQRHVAETLCTTEPEGRLEAGEVEVRVRENGPHDLNVASFGIEVIANHTPEREQYLNARARGLKALLFSDPKFPVAEDEEEEDRRLWVRLQYGACVEA